MSGINDDDAAAARFIAMHGAKDAQPFTMDAVRTAVNSMKHDVGSYEDLLDIVRRVANFDKRDVTMMEMLTVVGMALFTVKEIDAQPDPKLSEDSLEEIEIEIPDGVALQSIPHPLGDVTSWEDSEDTGVLSPEEAIAALNKEILRLTNLRNPLLSQAAEYNRQIRALQDTRRQISQSH